MPAYDPNWAQCPQCEEEDNVLITDESDRERKGHTYTRFWLECQECEHIYLAIINHDKESASSRRG